MIGVYAGSFCPITLGHVDAIERAAKTVDTLYVVVGVNNQKNYSLSNSDRLKLTQTALAHISNVKVCLHEGMMTDFCKQVGADVMIKSIRNTRDMQEVIDLTATNKQFWGGETVFIVSAPQYQHVSSSLVRELVGLNQDISQLVPTVVAEETVKLLKK